MIQLENMMKYTDANLYHVFVSRRTNVFVLLKTKGGKKKGPTNFERL